VERWDLRQLAWRPHNPEILSSSQEGRAIVLDLAAGGTLQEHQVHEGAWIVVIDGAIAVTDQGGGPVEAEVRWTKGTQFGCEFKERFNLKLLQPTAPTTKSHATVAPDYLKGEG